MQSISSAIEKINSNQGDLYLVGGMESMSNIPLYSDELKFNHKIPYARSLGKTKTISYF